MPQPSQVSDIKPSPPSLNTYHLTLIAYHLSLNTYTLYLKYALAPSRMQPNSDQISDWHMRYPCSDAYFNLFVNIRQGRTAARPGRERERNKRKNCRRNDFHSEFYFLSLSIPVSHFCQRHPFPAARGKSPFRGRGRVLRQSMSRHRRPAQPPRYLPHCVHLLAVHTNFWHSSPPP